MTANLKVLRWIRWGSLLLAAALVATRNGTHGFVQFILMLAASWAIIGFALYYIEKSTKRPVKTYLRWGLASFTLGLLLVVLPFASGADVLTGLILWLGFSAAGLVWTVYYERSEPL
jgi:hypothetical protein